MKRKHRTFFETYGMRCTLCCVALILAVSPIHAAEPVEWTAEWEAPDFPTISIPVWAYYGGGEITQTDELNIQSTMEESTAGYFLPSGSDAWNPGPDGVTVEFELRVNSMEGEHACTLIASGFGPDKNKAFVVFVGLNSVRLYNGPPVALEEGVFHKFRLIIKDEEASLYMKGERRPIATSTDFLEDSKSSLSFGDLSGLGGGNVDWKSINWTDLGAFAP